MKKWKRVFLMLFAGCILISSCACRPGNAAPDNGASIDISVNIQLEQKPSPEETETEKPKKVYVAWSNEQDSYSYMSVLDAIKAAGGEAVVLDMVRSADLTYDENGRLVGATDKHGILTKEAAKLVKNNKWQNSNVIDLMKDVDCVVVPGGNDLSPTLFYEEQAWHGLAEDSDFSAERDVSDFILLSYCIDNDVPVLAICRGMQILGVVSGAEMIQDLPQWYRSQKLQYHYEHRDRSRKKFVVHDVDVLSRSSLLYKVTGKNVIKNVPSWHHQSIKDVDNTRLVITGEVETGGVKVIEAIERRDKTFCLGVQYHPECAVKKRLNGEKDAWKFMSVDDGLVYFKALMQFCK